MQNTCEYFFDNVRSVHWGMNAPPPPQKHPLSFLPSPPLNWQTVQAPFLGNPPSKFYVRI